jgi:hypothetical protein
VAVVTVEIAGSETAFPVPVVVRPGRRGLVVPSSGVVPATSVDAFEDDGGKNEEKSHDGSDSDCRNSKLDVLVDVSAVVVCVVASVVAFVTIWRLT